MRITKWLRRLTPLELERLNGFPDNHTEGVTDGTRAFFMGNALVCGIVGEIAEALSPGETDELSPRAIIPKIISAHQLGIDRMKIELEEISKEGKLQDFSKLYSELSRPKKKKLRDRVSEPIHITGGLELHPMLKFSGSQATSAYRHQFPRKNWKKSNRYMNANRRFVGLLDFQIIDHVIWNEDKGKMNHVGLMKEVIRLLNADVVRKIYHGLDINSLDLTDEQKPIAVQLMCAFIEQEINWGTQIFQKHTNFGSTEFMWRFVNTPRFPDKCNYLQDAVPRDFYCSHLLYLFDQLKSDPNLDIEPFLNKNLRKTDTTTKATIQPPIDNEHIRPGYEPFMLSYQNNSVVRWIQPFLDEVVKLCKLSGPNHLWGDNYEADDKGNITIIDECPGEGDEWPEITLHPTRIEVLDQDD